MTGLDVSLKRPSELSDAERGAWRALVAADPALTSPYFALEFAECCEEARNDTWIMVMRRQGAIRAFLPLQAGRFGYTRPLAGPLGDMHGLIAEPGVEIDLAACLKAAGLPVFQFHSALASQAAFRPLTHEREGGWMVDTSEGFEGWKEQRRKAQPKAVRNINTRYRRLEEAEGGYRVDMVDMRPEAFDAMVAWKRGQYACTQVFDVFSVAWTHKLMQAVLRRQSEGFYGICSTLSVGGRIAAVHVGMASERSCQFWFPAYNPDFAALSPGLLLLAETIRWSETKGFQTIELGKGDFAFKKDLSTYQVGLAAGYYASPSALGIARRAGEALVRSAETAPIGPLAHWPGKAMRKLDRLAGFHAA